MILLKNHIDLDEKVKIHYYRKVCIPVLRWNYFDISEFKDCQCVVKNFLQLTFHWFLLLWHPMWYKWFLTSREVRFHSHWRASPQRHLYQRDHFDWFRPVGWERSRQLKVFRRRQAGAALHWIGSIQGSSIMQVCSECGKSEKNMQFS